MAVLLLRLLATLLHMALLFGLAPMLTGLVAALQARLLGRRGPPITQPYRDLLKLSRKQNIIPATATALYPVWPYVGFAALAGAAWLAPGFAHHMLNARPSDLVTLAGLLALAGAAAILAGLETGFAFGAAGAARAALAGLFGQTVFLLAILALAIGTGTPSQEAQAAGPLPAAFTLLALLAVALAETGFLPAAAAAGAEPAMVQGAMMLEYAGPYLALLAYTGMLRLLVWLCLIAGFGLPFGLAEAGTILSWPAGLLAWLAKLGALAALLALFHGRFAARLAFPVPAWLGAGMLLAVLASIFGLAGRGL